MENNTIKVDYKIIPFAIDKQNINDFVLMENRRLICYKDVARLHKNLINKENPIGTLIVNMLDGKMRLIDGNHRIEAIKRFFNNYSKSSPPSIQCNLKVYEGLSNEEEREVYSKEARRRNESYEDRLQIYKDTITFWKLLNDPLEQFPCKVSIYQSSNTMKLRTLLNAINVAKINSGKGYRPDYLRKEELVEFAQNIGYDDFLLMKGFINFFQDVFGRIEKENIFAGTQFFIPLFDIYVKNLEVGKTEDFKERFSKLIGRADLMFYSTGGGRETQIKIRKMMIDYLNHGRQKHLFV